MLTKFANLVKQTVRTIKILAIMTKKKQLKKYFAKLKINKGCFNYRKKGHYAKNYYISNKKKLEKLLKKAKHTQQKKN